MNKTMSLKADLEQVAKDGLVTTLSSLTTRAGAEAAEVAVANILLLDRKQQDYGPKNISSFGSFGVVVRLNDKMERLKHIYMKKGRKRRVVNESIIDTFRDIANYATIALLIELDRWPSE